MLRSLFRLTLISLATLLAQAGAFAQNGLLSYNGDYREIEGEQPFTYSYSVAITGIFIPALGTAASAPLEVISLSRPAGVSEATALSFVSLSQPSISFFGSGIGQTNNITISINVPAGNNVGDYAYRIRTTGVWSNGLSVGDNGTLINMKVTDPGAAAQPPSVTITSPADQSTFTYSPANGPLLIPFTFTAAANDAFPIQTVDADLNSTAVAVTATGLNTNSVNGSGTLSITAGGLYTLRARASNADETSTDTVEFTVNVSAPPPTITAAQPSNNAVYTYTVGGPAVQVPVSFTATSLYGAINAISATLNGTAISSLVPSGLGTLEATGSATLSITTPGTYSLVYSGTSDQGTASTTISFTVNSVAPTPVVTISDPAPNTVITRVAGSPASSVPYSFQATTPAGTIQSVSLTLNGNPVTPTVGGLNTATATGSGSFSIAAPGTYTLVATGSNGSAVASASRTFTVNETTPPPPNYSMVWLPPITDGQTIVGGEVMPIRFSVALDGTLVSEQSVVVAIYEVFANGTTAAPTYYTYGAYSITSNVYNLNFTTAAGVHRYKVEVYTSSATAAQLLGTKEINTKAATPPPDDDDDCDHHHDCDRDHHRNRNCNRNNSHDHDCDRNHDRNRDCNHNNDRNHGRDCDRDHSWYRSCNNNDRHDHDRNCDHDHDRNRKCNHNKDRTHDRDCDRDHDRNRSCNRNDRDDRNGSSNNGGQSWLGNLISGWFRR